MVGVGVYFDWCITDERKELDGKQKKSHDYEGQIKSVR